MKPPRLIWLVAVTVILAACASQATGPADLAVAETESGSVLTDRDGFTLYLFLPDQQAGSTCLDACPDTWPPLTTETEVVAGEGIDPELVGSVARPDGTTQVTYNGWPLYRYAGDQAPGDTLGHRLLNAWFAIGPSGGAVGPTR